MKKTILLFLTLLFVSGCTSSIDDLSNDERAKLVAIGDAASRAFQQSLFTHLSTALSDGGTAHAISACNIESVNIAKAAQIGFSKSLDIKRVSLKYRNPKNAPDEYDTIALHYLANTDINSGDVIPVNTMQKIESETGTVFRFYHPLRTADMCLQCHGTDKYISKIVSEKLNELYPNDLAVGYKKGDFRGAIRIQISEENLMK